MLFSAIDVAPAAAQVQVTSPSVIEHSARPGARLEGSIVVRNLSATDQEVRVYQTDYQFSADGRSEFAAPGTLPRSNARWIALSPTRFTITAGGVMRVGYVIAVPSSVALAAGTHWSAIMVEAIASGSPESSRPGAPARVRLGVDVAVRHAVQIAVNINGGDAHAAIRLSNPAISTGSTGARQLSVDAMNSGEIAVRPILRIDVLDDDGRRVAHVEQQRGLLYPASSMRQLFDLGVIPRGTYRAVVVADTGGDELFGAKFTLQF